MSATIAPQIAAGSTLTYRLKGATGTGTALGTVMKMSGPDIEVNEIECNLLNSTVQQAIPGIPKLSGGFTIRVDSNETTIAVTFATAAFTHPIPTYTWRVTKPDGSGYEIDGFCKGSKPSEKEIETLMTLDFEVRYLTMPDYFAAPSQA